MTGISPKILVVFCLFFLLGGCGYYFPNVYSGPEVSIYMPVWQNRTDKLDIDTVMYHSLSGWFQRSERVNLTRTKEGANLILAGEIISIQLPGVGWNTQARATDVKVKLHLRYVLQDVQSGKILWEMPSDIWTEDYNTLAAKADNEDKAIRQILRDVSERIYLGTLARVQAMHRDQ